MKQLKKSDLEKKMYSLVIYQLSGIQAGIQAGHATDEYEILFNNDPDYLDWLLHWKTVIVLNGGSSNSGKESYYGVAPEIGTMETHLETLSQAKVKAVPFYEPELNYAMTAMSFLVDERVFNKTKYPDPDIDKATWMKFLTSKSIKDIIEYQLSEEDDKKFKEFLKIIGGAKNLFLRLWLKDFQLARN